MGLTAQRGQLLIEPILALLFVVVFFIMLIVIATSAAYHLFSKKEKTRSSSTCRKKYSDGVCAICLAGMETTVLACGHEYHKECILNMRNHNNTTCPQCREPIPAHFLETLEGRNASPVITQSQNWNITDVLRAFVIF